MSSKPAPEKPRVVRPLLPTYGMRLSLVYVLTFAVATSVLVALLYANAVRALDRETDEVVEAEWRWRSGGR